MKALSILILAAIVIGGIYLLSNKGSKGGTATPTPEPQAVIKQELETKSNESFRIEDPEAMYEKGR